MQSTVLAECNPPFGGEGDQCCKSGDPSAFCSGMDCVCNSHFVCTPPADPNDPDPRWKCRISCGNLGEDCCLTNTPADKCESGLACYSDNNHIRKCRECGVVSGPCCVIGNQCGVDGNGDPLVPAGSGESCTCELNNPPPVACGTNGYPCCLEDDSGNVIGACDSGDSPCTCSEGICKDGAGPINHFYSTHCLVASDCGAEGQLCCASPDLPCDVSALICFDNHCCKDEDGDSVCDGSVGPPRPFGLLYTGPVIKNLQDILGPVAKMLYYGGLAIGVFFIILSGYRLMTSEGDPQRTKAAQEQLTSAIIGIIFILLSVTILRVIINQIIGENI